MHHDALTRRPIHFGDVIDWEFFAHQNIDQAFFESINTDPFSGPQWANLFGVNEPIYRELVHEFFASFEFDASPCRKKLLIAMGIIMELYNGVCIWPMTRTVEEGDEAKEEVGGEAANEGDGGSAKMYRNMSQGDWQVRQARWMDKQDERWEQFDAWRGQ
ncbi:hypothetical protein Tco_1354895 [Tanacetum coccineum]